MYNNPTIITWARTRSHLSIEELAARMKRDPEEIRIWESGEKAPSYTVLEELAYRHFHIPLALFFFPEPPDIEDAVNQFRRLPDYEFARLSSNTLRIIRLAQGYQESLKELIDPSMLGRRIFNEINTNGRDITELTQEVRKFLGITIERQCDFGNLESALKAWRHSIENAGIFTFKDAIKDRFISGFCLLDDYFPIILLNNSNSFTRQIFTLIHELGHILFQIHGISDIDEKYIEYMSPPEKALEINCNIFAAELLVPSKEFNEDIQYFKEFNDDIISEIANKYSVSREVILRKLFDIGLVSQEHYRTSASEWNADYLRTNYKEKGGNWYLTRLAYLGEGFTKQAIDSYYQGRISKEELGYHLNVNSKNIDKLEAHLVR